jgi:hypothetical protein
MIARKSVAEIKPPQPAPIEQQPQPSIFRAGIEIMKATVRNISQPPAEALAEAERRIAELQDERASKLIDAEGDYLADIAAIDDQIRTHQANVVVHNDRIAALAIRKARQEKKRRANEREAAIAEVKKLIPRRQASAERIDVAVKEMAAAFDELAATDEAIFKNWPDVMPSADRFGYLRAMRIDVLSPARKQKMVSGLVRELVNRAPFNLAAEVEKCGRELVDELEGRTTDEQAA